MVLERPCIPRTKYTASNPELYHQRALDIAATDPIQVAHLTARAHQGVSMPTSYSTMSLIPLEFEQFWFRCDGMDTRVMIVVACEELGGPWNRDKDQLLVMRLIIF